MKSKSEILIENLQLNLQPVRQIKWPWIFVAHLLLFAILGVAWILFDGFRSDIATQILNPWFLLEAMSLVVLLFGGAYVLSRWVVPGNDYFQKGAKCLGFGTLGFWCVLFGLLFVGEKFDLESMRQNFGMGCLICVTLLTFICAFSSFLIVKKAAPVEAAWTGLFSSAVAAGFGVFLLQLSCPYNHPMHLLTSHFPPVALACAIGYFLGRQFLKF
jgi:hypothetical protein